MLFRNKKPLPECPTAYINRATHHAGVAQLVRAPACHAGGREFKSRHSRHSLPMGMKQKSTSVFTAGAFLFSKSPLPGPARCQPAQTLRPNKAALTLSFKNTAYLHGQSAHHSGGPIHSPFMLRDSQTIPLGALVNSLRNLELIFAG